MLHRTSSGLELSERAFGTILERDGHYKLAGLGKELWRSRLAGRP